MRFKLPRRRALFLALTLILLSVSQLVRPVWADAFIGYTNSQASGGGINCLISGNPACSGCNQTNCGYGLAVQAPTSGTLISVGFTTGNLLPTQIIIATLPAGVQPTKTSQACGTSPSAGTCSIDTGGTTYTMQDVETLSGLSTFGAFTVGLASPVSVVVNQWTLMMFRLPNNAGAYFMEDVASGQGSLTFVDTIVNFGSTLPSTGSTFVTVAFNGNNAGTDGGVIGGTFRPTGTTGTTLTQTQCYGNCGTPAVTLANTNSTHSINFNQTITLFYEFQSNLNGFIQNVTTSVAKSYNNGQVLYLGFYAAPCPAGNLPFTNACPGSLQGTTSITNPLKGKASLVFTQGSISVSNGEWLGVAVSGGFSGLDLNDTNTNVNIFQASGIMPAVISQNNQLTSCACKIGLWGWIIGNVVTGGGATGPSVTCGAGLDCILSGITNSFCTNLTAACQTGSAIFWVIILTGISMFGLIYAVSSIIPNVNVTRLGLGELGILIFLGWIVAFTSFGLMSLYVVVLVFFIVSWLFVGRIRGTGPI
jgi:hypothetical protein